jgi:hypothetical protein
MAKSATKKPKKPAKAKKPAEKKASKKPTEPQPVERQEVVFTNPKPSAGGPATKPPLKPLTSVEAEQLTPKKPDPVVGKKAVSIWSSPEDRALFERCRERSGKSLSELVRLLLSAYDRRSITITAGATKVLPAAVTG